jgi:hypothetical protein
MVAVVGGLKKQKATTRLLLTFTVFNDIPSSQQYQASSDDQPGPPGHNRHCNKTPDQFTSPFV